MQRIGRELHDLGVARPCVVDLTMLFAQPPGGVRQRHRPGFLTGERLEVVIRQLGKFRTPCRRLVGSLFLRGIVIGQVHQCVGSVRGRVRGGITLHKRPRILVEQLDLFIIARHRQLQTGVQQVPCRDLKLLLLLGILVGQGDRLGGEIDNLSLPFLELRILRRIGVLVVERGQPQFRRLGQIPLGGSGLSRRGFHLLVIVELFVDVILVIVVVVVICIGTI